MTNVSAPGVAISLKAYGDYVRDNPALQGNLQYLIRPVTTLVCLVHVPLAIAEAVGRAVIGIFLAIPAYYNLWGVRDLYNKEFSLINLQKQPNLEKSSNFYLAFVLAGFAFLGGFTQLCLPTLYKRQSVQSPPPVTHTPPAPHSAPPRTGTDFAALSGSAFTAAQPSGAGPFAPRTVVLRTLSGTGEAVTSMKRRYENLCESAQGLLDDLPAPLSAENSKGPALEKIRDDITALIAALKDLAETAYSAPGFLEQKTMELTMIRASFDTLILPGAGESKGEDDSTVVSPSAFNGRGRVAAGNLSPAHVLVAGTALERLAGRSRVGAPGALPGPPFPIADVTDVGPLAPHPVGFTASQMSAAPSRFAALSPGAASSVVGSDAGGISRARSSSREERDKRLGERAPGAGRRHSLGSGSPADSKCLSVRNAFAAQLARGETAGGIGRSVVGPPVASPVVGSADGTNLLRT